MEETEMNAINTNWFKTLAVVLTLGLAGTGGQLSAQDEDEQRIYELDPFTITEEDADGYRALNVVSGTLTKTDIRDLPINIGVVTGDLLEDMDTLRVEESIRYLSGVGLSRRNETSRGSTRGETFAIRGYETSQVLRNGIRLQGITNSVNIERIEILKGPSAIFYGASDPGGVVNYITKRPHDTRTGRVKVGLGSWKYKIAEFDYNTPLDADKKFLFRIMGSVLDNETRRRFENLKQYFINPILLYNISENTKLVFDYQFRKADGIQERAGDMWLTADNPNPHRQQLLEGELLARSLEIGLLTPTDTFHQDEENFLVEFSHDFGDELYLKASFQTSESNRLHRFVLTTGRIARTPDGDWRFTDRPSIQEGHGFNDTININLSKTFTTEKFTNKILFGWERFEVENTKVLLTDFSNHTTQRTLFSDWETLSEEEYFAVKQYPDLNYPGHWDPATRTAGAGYRAIQNNVYDPVWDQGVYVVNQFTAMNERLNILAGLRWSTLRRIDQTDTTPQFGATYSLTENVQAYYLQSESFRPNGRSDPSDPNSDFFPPENGEGQEIGLKFSAMDGKLTGTSTLFLINKTNVQRADSGAVVEGRIGRYLADGERSEGFELDLVYTPLPSFQMIFAYANINAHILESPIGNNTPDTDGDGIADIVGMGLRANSPETIALFAKYNIDDGGPLDGFAFGGGLQRRDGPIHLDGSFNRALVVEDGYTRIDIFASYDTTIGNYPVKFQMNIDNVTEEFYADKALQYADLAGEMGVKFSGTLRF